MNPKEPGDKLCLFYTGKMRALTFPNGLWAAIGVLRSGRADYIHADPATHAQIFVFCIEHC
jgi:hypothetical protein